MHLRHATARATLAAILVCAAPAALAQYVSLVGGTPTMESFDTLASSDTGTALPDGWYFFETGSNANTTYTADDGTLNNGNTYSYGASGSSERALGAVRSGSLESMFGAQLRNDSGSALSEIAVSYVGEQWRLGASGRPDRLDFQYSVDATSLNDAGATWTDVDALDFAAPVNSGTVGALDGNAAANRSTISGSITGLNLAPSATLWVRWRDFNASGADDGQAIDEVSFAVAGGPPVDNPPTLVSTTPANGAQQVAVDATLAALFNEAVTLGSGWYSLTCATSGVHTLAASAGPTSYSFSVTPAFVQAETCTWVLHAAAITDLDGTPDALAGGDVTITFDTFDPANVPPPTVVSTIPTNGAVNVPRGSDIRITFSEAVTTTAGAFALACGGSPRTINESGSGANRTLTPDQLLPAGASCTFTLDGAHVHNTSGIAMVGVLTLDFTVADNSSVDAYYQHVNTSSPEQLRCSLHETIKGHTVYPYSGGSQNVWTILELAQQDPGNPNKIIDVYRNRSYNTVSDRAGTGSGITYNREHTWPNSLGFANNSLAAYTDTHMLWLSDTAQNAARGNKPYGNCPSSAGCTELPTEVNQGVGGPGQSNWVKTPDGNSGTFEVWNHRKGEMARAMFYMAIRYEGISAEDAHDGNIPDLELTDNRSLIVITGNGAATAYMGLLTDLLAWHMADPPDAAEVARNDLIQTFQGNRNPFVDHPEWVSRALFESSQPATCELVQPSDVIFDDGFDLN
ncbi:MAG: hypothetical protein F9K31_06315 [Dokdonella sp.]|nr:MAG: hypothetical protein F9K31_06315 [Dokdonella sp.]